MKILCVECAKIMAKNRQIELINLADFFEDENIVFDVNNIYQCHRLKHARPITHYIKYKAVKNKYEVGLSCSFCRNYKAIENILKKKNCK